MRCCLFFIINHFANFSVFYQNCNDFFRILKLVGVEMLSLVCILIGYRNTNIPYRMKILLRCYFFV